MYWLIHRHREQAPSHILIRFRQLSLCTAIAPTPFPEQ
ncbi:hypothetical protein C4J84_1796 [Pseudomonas sp. R11-23-07]|nr:hypothetical protein C4J86_1889 [Pseudomonas sp. R2-7-07]AZF57687.1 hypothetical protein C4J84_1796 [Pseudomonas sp. R11-23-07]